MPKPRLFAQQEKQPCTEEGIGWRTLRSLSKTRRAIFFFFSFFFYWPRRAIFFFLSFFFVFLFYWQRRAIFVCLPSPICSSQPSRFCIFLKVLFYVTLLSNCPLSFVGRQYKDMGLSWVALALDEWKLFLQNCLFHLCLMSKACSTLPQ